MLSRSRIPLDGQWQFWIDPDCTLTPESLPQDKSQPISVPAPWQSQNSELRFYSGTGWYRREVELPPEWFQDQAIILGFGAVDYLAEVWLNGQRIGEHEGGYLPFEFDVTHAACPGANSLIVRVSDPVSLFPEVPHGKQSWYGPISGLWQPVWMESRPAMHLVRARITPDREQVHVSVSTSRALSAEESLRFEVISPGGEIASECVSQDQDVMLQVKDPLLWDIDTPHLYTLRISLHKNGETSQDSITETFGFRAIETRDGQILLNGRPIYLRGALDQDYYPDLIYTPPSEAYIEDQFRKAKEMGLNCLRLHIKVGDPRYYAAADRLGLLIWTELPNWESLTPASRQRALDTLIGMVERDWNHPSIIIWTIVNESWGVDLTNDEHCAWLSETFDTLKELDPNRLIVGNSACYSNFHIVTDVEDFHNYAAIPDHYRKWRTWVRTFANRPSWTFARTYEGHRSWKKFLRYPWRVSPFTSAPSVRRRGDEPLVISEFGNWGLPAIDRLRECYGGQEPWWFETGFEATEGIVYPHGIEQRFQRYHLERAFSSLTDLTEASQSMQFRALKYEIEQIRRYSSIQGYVVTEFTDVHWESNGLLDMCRNPKNYYAELEMINNPDLIIPNWRRVAYWSGEQVRIPLLFSHFSEADLQESYLEWQLEGWPEIRGTIQDISPVHAQVTPLGLAAFRVPSVGEAQRARLALHLFDRNGGLAARNYQELYFFPRLKPETDKPRLFAPEMAEPLRRLGYMITDDLATADMAVVSVMTDDLRDYLQRGGRILWLAEKQHSLQTYLGNLKIRPRKGRVWQGDWANNFNWINQDKLFSGMPTNGLVDFAFAGLTPEMVITGIKPLEFATYVHAGLFVGWLHKVVALIAEQRFGRGQLIISTFRLRRQMAEHPVAAGMVQEMIRYLTGFVDAE